MNWYGFQAEHFEINKNPPFVAYLIAAVASILVSAKSRSTHFSSLDCHFLQLVFTYWAANSIPTLY